MKDTINALRVLRSDLANYQSAITDLMDLLDTAPERLRAKPGTDATLDRCYSAFRRQNILSQRVADALKKGA